MAALNANTTSITRKSSTSDIFCKIQPVHPDHARMLRSTPTHHLSPKRICRLSNLQHKANQATTTIRYEAAAAAATTVSEWRKNSSACILGNHITIVLERASRS